MFGLGSGEILVIALIALLLFGKEDLPATVRKVSKGLNDFRKATSSAQRQWTEIKDDVARTLLDEGQQPKPLIRPAEHSLPTPTEEEVASADSDHHNVERSAEPAANADLPPELPETTTKPVT